MKPESLRCLMIGLPATGKTTFLAALWQVAETGDVPGCLRVKTLDRDDTYLNAIRSRWLDGLDLGRTQISLKSVSMVLEDQNTEQTVEVTFPDLSGETFENQWTQRRWEEQYAALVDEADGALLFVHPDRLTEPTPIYAADEICTHLGEQPGCLVGSTGSSEEVEWKTDLAPTQVILVELLQFLMARRPAYRGFRLGVVVSAWDTLGPPPIRPEQWVEKRLPLLHQYLTSNDDFFVVEYFGLSAQGGDLNSDRIALLRRDRPSDRIRVVWNGSESHDVTLLVRWMMCR